MVDAKCASFCACVSILIMRHSVDLLRRFTALCFAAILLFAESYGRTALTVTTKDQQTTNVDTLVKREANVSISCKDEVTGRPGVLSVNSETTTLPSPSSGEWIIPSMSVADQGAYECCVGVPPCQENAILSELKACKRLSYINCGRTCSTVALSVSCAFCRFKL